MSVFYFGKKEVKNMKKIKEFLRKNERYIKTFVEAFASYVALNVMMTDLNSMTALEGLIVGAIGSGLSVLINKFDKNKDDEGDW